MKKLRIYLRSIMILSSFMIAASSAQALSPAWPEQHWGGQAQWQWQFQFQWQGQGQGGGYHPPRPSGCWYWHNGRKYWGKCRSGKPKPVKKVRISSKNHFEDILVRIGYRHVHRVKFTGRYYHARAINRHGHKVWVKFDCYTGRKVAEKILTKHVYR